jgi:hypothetical protein
MATLLNSRNSLLADSPTRILGAGVYITSGAATGFTIPANGSTAVPGTIVLTAVPSRYVTPSYTWSRRFGDTGAFEIIAGETNPVLNVLGNEAFVSSATGFSIVQYKVDLVETGGPSANPSSFTLTLPILRQGTNSILGVLSNESQTVYADSTGAVQGSPVIQSTLYIYNGTSDDSANWAVSISSVGVTASLINGKTINVTAVNNLNGYVDITATRQGYANIVKRFTVNKVLAGAAGSPGANTALVYAYQRAATAPATNPGDITYSFTTNTITTATLANSWSKTIPTGTNPLYVTVATASSDTSSDTILAAEWSTPVLLVQNGTNGTNGTNGLNTATVYLYARNNSTVTAPTLTTTGSATYTFSTSVLSGTIPSGWTTTIPDVANGTTIWVAQATASSNTATDSIANTEWSVPRVLAQKGLDGADGVSPTSYEVSVNSPVINKATNNTLTPSSIVVNGFSITGSTKSAYSGRFKIYEDGVLKYTSSVNQTTYTYTPSSTSVNLFKVELYLAGGTTTLLDSQEIPVVVSGSSGITISISNSAFTAPADSTGAVSTYLGSGTTIQVFEGSTNLTYLTTLGTTASSFTIGTPTLSVANAITVGARSGNGTTTATVADHSGMSTSVSAVVITYPITYNRANGAQATQTVTQSITKAAAGSVGVRGSRQVYATDAVYTPTYDIDGAGAVAAGAASYAARATQLIATVTAGLNPTTPINGDTVTFSNGSNYVYTITHNGTSWVPPGTIIDGSLLVTGSVTASKINSNGLEVRAPNGDLILGSSGLQSYSLISGTKPPVDATNGATLGVNLSGQITSANASTYIADAAIGSAQIVDASITRAKIGAAAIGTAQIEDASVNTLQIANEAVTIPVGSFIASNTTVGTSYSILASVTLTTDGTLNFLVVAGCSHNGINFQSHSPSWDIAIYRDATELVWAPVRNNYGYATDFISVINKPPEGTVTYTLRGKAVSVGGANSTVFSNRLLNILGIKR